MNIYEFVAKQRDSYRSDTIEITDGYEFSQYETLRTIEFYDNDRFFTGNLDELEREKPFYNIVSFRKNVATRATDLDTKEVQIQSERVTKTSYAETFEPSRISRMPFRSSRTAMVLIRRIARAS